MEGLLLCDWLRSIENQPAGTTLQREEQKVMTLVKELLAEVDISVGDGERLSAATLKIWAGTFDDIWVWGRIHLHSTKLTIVTPFLAKVLRRFADHIQESSRVGHGYTSRMDPPSASYVNS